MATTDIVRRARTVALAAICALVVAASLVSFAESYRGLYDWAGGHGLSGIWQAAWPLMIDAFIAVGELTLFVALADGWKLRTRIGAWLIITAGLAASVAGNIGHVAGHELTVRATAAVPPLAAAAAMAVGLGVLKRVIAARADVAADAADVATLGALSLSDVTSAGDMTVPAEVTPAAAPVVTSRPRRAAPKATPKATPKAAAVVTPQRAEADRILSREPDITHAELARRVRVTERTVQRWRKPDDDTDTAPPVRGLSVVHDTAEAR
jgi:hypothetical protein